MSAFIAANPVPVSVLALLIGLAMGLFHFSTLKRVSAMYLDGTPVWQVLGLQLARLAVLVAIFVVMALAGAMPLLAGAIGLLLGRIVVMRRARKGD
ncbi:N-ATPase subunit AtpR [Chachezhania sediminis]|uniref:N-ATPase subunit AtpR n=1 Tax=Chachezhania sediminis TaxID=2599291 RepID=UPI00131AC469|nr:ATP synthase subunit I [Chachezhania sediminis]